MMMLTLCSERATKLGAPEWGWRMTMILAPIACRVRAVLRSDSPFSTLLPEPDMLMTSALSTLPASSKEMRVRVRAS